MMSEAETQLQRAKRILEISHELTSTVSLEDLLKQIVEAAVELTDCQSAGILLLTEQEDALHFMIASDSAGELTGISLIRNAVAHGKLVIDEISSRVQSAMSHTEYDVAIIGAGPAGITSALRAQEQGLRYILAENIAIVNYNHFLVLLR